MESKIIPPPDASIVRPETESQRHMISSNQKRQSTNSVFNLDLLKNIT